MRGNSEKRQERDSINIDPAGRSSILYRVNNLYRLIICFRGVMRGDGGSGSHEDFERREPWILI